MASVKFEKDSKEWNYFQEFYKLVQTFWKPEDKDEYWDNAITAILALVRKYPDDLFIQYVSFSFSEYIQDIAVIEKDTSEENKQKIIEKMKDSKHNHGVALWNERREILKLVNSR